MDQLVQQVQLVILVQLVIQDQQDRLVLLVRQVLLDLLVPLERQVQLVQLVRQAQMQLAYLLSLCLVVCSRISTYENQRLL